MRFPSWLPILLGVLSAVGPISTDMYLPAFPAIEATYGGHAGTAQITLATWFLGLAIGQITQGSLSDRFGRRGPLIVGTVIYTLASAGCALAPDLTTLAVLRCVAAFGGSASMVIPRAIVRDLSEGLAAARMMSRLILIMGAAPILAPTLGGFILGAASWHAIFWICTLYGAVCCALVVWKLPDTMPKPMRVSLSLSRMAHRYGRILVERGFITHAMLGGFAMFGMFGYLGGSPAVFIERFGLSPGTYGALFGACAAGFILGSQISPRLLPKYGAGRVMRAAARVYLAASLVVGLVAFSGIGPWYLTSLPILVALTSMGFILPNATVGALQRHANHAGSASALMGTLQFCLGAVSGLSVGLLADGTSRPMAALMILGSLGAVIAEIARPRGPLPLTPPTPVATSTSTSTPSGAEPSRIRTA
jgi:DHA1 family bicyclomycin/chloramphenicol resistance-like MFS transporter